MTKAPLFTLPNTVLLPGIVLPLHIFEERYRNMVNDIEDFGNKFILSFAEKEVNKDYVPQKHACLAEVLYIEELPDGKKNIVIEGLEYVTLGNFDTSDRKYYLAEFEEYNVDKTSTISHEEMRKEITYLVKKISLLSLNFTTTTLELVTGDQNIDHLLNKVVYFYLFPYEEQQNMLEERFLEHKFKYMFAYLSAVLRDIKKNTKTLNFPKSMAKKLN